MTADIVARLQASPWSGENAFSLKQQAIAEIERLRAELARWATWGIIEVAIRNPSVASYMEHWEERATKAESERNRLRAALERIADPTAFDNSTELKALARAALRPAEIGPYRSHAPPVGGGTDQEKEPPT